MPPKKSKDTKKIKEEKENISTVEDKAPDSSGEPSIAEIDSETPTNQTTQTSTSTVESVTPPTPIATETPVQVSPSVDVPPVINTLPEVSPAADTVESTKPESTTIDIGEATASESDDDIFAEEQQGSGKKLFFIFFIALMIGALIVGGFFFFMSRNQSSDIPNHNETEVTPVESSEEIEASSEADATDKAVAPAGPEISTLSIKILNGSGVTGQAGIVEDLLTAAGFDNFSTGNADKFDYQDTEVQMKETVEISVYEAIVSALEAYTVVEGDVLDENSDSDIIIIVGQKS